MNKFPIEIDGKEYVFTVNRNVLKELNMDSNAITVAKSIEAVEDMFYVFIKTNHPMTKKDAMLLMDKAEEEFGGFKTLAEAMGVIAERGFTMNADATKKISWLEIERAKKAEKTQEAKQ
jgi:hypothetical protein